MKKRKQILLLILIICLALPLIFTACGKEEKINIANGNFEDAQSLNGWFISDYELDYNDDDTAADIVIGEGKDGKCVSITNYIPDDSRVYQTVSVKPKSCYKITVDVKTENVSDEGAGAIISAISVTDTSPGIHGTTDWQTVTVYVKTAKKQHNLDLSLGLGGYSAVSTGTAMFDNLTVEKISSIPSGERALTLFKSSSSSGSSDSSKGNNLSPWLKLLFIALLLGLVALIIMLGLKSDEEERKGTLRKDEKRKLDCKDLVIILALTLACSFFSFYKLGDTKMATEYWKPSSNGEFVIVEFDEVTNITGMAHLPNIPKFSSNTVGYYAVYYEATEGAGDYVKAFEITSAGSETDSQKAMGSFFEWQISKIVNFTAKRVKIESLKPGFGINEIGFLKKGEDGEYEVVKATVSEESYVSNENGTPANLFDEQDLVKTSVTYMNGTYFDEIYHARTAYEFTKGLSVYETTHPPLGKIIMSWGIKIFGMNPFGWRFMGTLFGVLMVPLMYLFASKLFKKREYAILAAALVSVDFMRLAHSRLATIDSYSTFFIMLMYYFMYDYFTTKCTDPGSKRAKISLALCGISFGVGAATKWTCLYAGAGLAILFFAAEIFEAKEYAVNREYKNKNWFLTRFLPTCGMCVIFFVIIPGIIYTLSYIPWMPSNPNKSLFRIMLDNQSYMYNYHSKLNATHPYMSSWWSWPLDMRPIWLYLGDSDFGNRSTIASFGNPVIWMLSIPAIIFTVFYTIRNKEKKLLVILAAFALEFLPWILVTRCAFIYHYMPCVPFVILMIVYCFEKLIGDKVIPYWSGWLYIMLAAALLVIYYPALTGLEVKESYIEKLRLFSTWYF